ncbi:MAG: hypothetical protein HQL71_03385 [Magnetococcales bacterium]|nr:hypothetical protein [Magnetococcales bacterium]
MNQTEFEAVDAKRFEGLPSLSVAEAAWMAGVTLESYEKFMTVAGVDDLRSIKPDELLRIAFTLLGQKESQLVMLRLQLAATLQREKELADALGSKLSQHTPLPIDYFPDESSASMEQDSGKNKKKKKKKKFK